MPPALALYQPDIPQNTGTLLRTGACLDISVHIILPAGFTLSDKKIRRTGLDYLDQTLLVQHNSWREFETMCHDKDHRILLLTTRAQINYTEFHFTSRDILLLGRESAGVPDIIHKTVENHIKIPMRPNVRSLNVAVAGVMALGEALRQCHAFPQT